MSSLINRINEERIGQFNTDISPTKQHPKISVINGRHTFAYIDKAPSIQGKYDMMVWLVFILV